MSEEKKNYVFIGGRMQGKTRDLIHQLIEENKNLQQKVEQLENIRKEAIEYIKEKQKIQYKFALSHIECDDLLNILNKGDNKE